MSGMRPGQTNTHTIPINLINQQMLHADPSSNHVVGFKTWHAWEPTHIEIGFHYNSFFLFPAPNEKSSNIHVSNR